MARETVKHDRSEGILRAAIEAGAVEAGELTIVIVVDKSAAVDVASCAPSNAAADMICHALILALEKVGGSRADLKAKIVMGKS